MLVDCYGLLFASIKGSGTSVLKILEWIIYNSLYSILMKKKLLQVCERSKVEI